MVDGFDDGTHDDAAIEREATQELVEKLRSRVKELEADKERIERTFIRPLLDDDEGRDDDTLEFWATDYSHAMKRLGAVESIEAENKRLRVRVEKAEGEAHARDILIDEYKARVEALRAELLKRCTPAKIEQARGGE